MPIDAINKLSASTMTSEMPDTTTLNKKCPVYKVVLTGGPCGGKTTSASLISERFQALGWRVFVVPEASTVLQSGNVSFYNLNAEQVYNFQVNLIKIMISLEDSFVSIAELSGQKSLVICDRGALDCSAYVEPETWQAILDENNWSTVGLRDGRYDCVIHLVTAADGAKEFYTTLDDSVRTESPELACELDKKTQKAWMGHPYYYIVDNNTDFKNKVDRVMEAISKFIGENIPLRNLVKRKFLIKSAQTFPIEYLDYDVTHHYLLSNDGSESRLRKRGQFGVFMYMLTVRFPEQHGQALQLRRNLTGREYISFRDSQSDPKRRVIQKKRRSFIYEKQYYELDTYVSCRPGLMLLEAYLSPETEVNLPPFLNVAREVTKEEVYSMYNIALKDEYKGKMGLN